MDVLSTDDISLPLDGGLLDLSVFPEMDASMEFMDTSTSLPAISDSTLPFDANTEYILSSLMDQPPSSPPDDLSVFSEASPSISDPISDPEDIFNNIVNGGVSPQYEPGAKTPSPDPPKPAKKPTRKRGRKKDQPMDAAALQEQMLKKQRRMMKNRESASASRRKKKEHLENLERTVQEQGNTIASLRQEVSTLSQENQTLRQEIAQLRGQAPSTSSAKNVASIAGTTLMICFLCFSLNPFATTPSTTLVPLRAPVTPVRPTGRTLNSIGLLEDRSVTTTELARPLPPKQIQHENYDRQELDGWLERHKSKLLLHMNETDVIHRNTELVAADPTDPSNLTFRLDEAARRGMLRTVARRTDTSYIFCTEVQVLSATGTVPAGEKPKMSLVMPTPQFDKRVDKTVNATINTANLMKIDCDILNSKPIEVKSV